VIKTLILTILIVTSLNVRSADEPACPVEGAKCFYVSLRADGEFSFQGQVVTARQMLATVKREESDPVMVLQVAGKSDSCEVQKAQRELYSEGASFVLVMPLDATQDSRSGWTLYPPSAESCQE
jgi:hypothetical protein